MTTSFSNLYSDLFLLGIQLRSAKDPGSADLLRNRIIDLFNTVDRKGSDIPKDSRDQAKYAVAAYLDEMILSSPWSNRDEWSARPLQYEFFKEHIAGVEFFNRINAIRRALPANPGLLEVYYLCLILGFEGQYKIHGTEALKTLTEEVQAELGRSQEKQAKHGLSPHGSRPDELMEMVKQGIPAWVAFAFCLFVVVVYFLILTPMISHDAKGLADRLTQLLLSVNQ